jgi:hypothetical protein
MQRMRPRSRLFSTNRNFWRELTSNVEIAIHGIIRWPFGVILSDDPASPVQSGAWNASSNAARSAN